MARPKVVLTRTMPALFLQHPQLPQEPESSTLKHIELNKIQAYRLLFTNPHTRFPLDLPDTLFKQKGVKEPVYLAVDSKGILTCVETRAEDYFFRSSFAVHMMSSFVRPSPFLVPKFVVQWRGGVVFCKDQAEVLRLLSMAEWYIVQLFIQTKEQRAQKFRVKYTCGQHMSVRLIYKNRLYPYNTPCFQTILSRAETPMKTKKKGTTHHDHFRKSKFNDNAHIYTRSGAFSASFTEPEDCTILETHRQELEDKAVLLVEYMKDVVENGEDLLREAEFDLIRGENKWFFLGMKYYTTSKVEERVSQGGKPVRLRALSHCRNKSGEEVMKDINKVLRLNHSFVTRSQYIDLGEVQDRNIRLYALLKDSLAFEPVV